jgi:hypothetical protein
MNIFIPEIGTEIKLTQGWVFYLYTDYRNDSIFQALGTHKDNLKQVFPKDSTGYLKCYEMFLPADTVLKVNRVYIRQGISGYSSVTFSICDTTHPFLIYHKKLKKTKKQFGRFWAKLCDVNKIQCEIVKNTQINFGENNED